MAQHGSDYHRGEMDIQEQVSTYHLVMGMTKWGALAIAAIVLFFTMWLCAKAGFIGAAAATIVLVVLGVVFLRDKPQAH